MKYLHRLFGTLFSIYYLNLVLALGFSFFNQPFYMLPQMVLIVLLVSYFLMMVMHSYNHDPRRIYPIVFAVMIGIILLLPEYSFINIFFLITYVFMYSRREPWAIPLSFIAIGNFIAAFIFPVGLALITYGWITYAIKKPV